MQCYDENEEAYENYLNTLVLGVKLFHNTFQK